MLSVGRGMRLSMVAGSFCNLAPKIRSLVVIQQVTHGVEPLSMKPLYAAILLLISSVAAAEHPSSFSAAKRILDRQIYTGNDRVTFYCGCNYAPAPNPNKPSRTRLTPDADSCGLKPRKNADR